MCAQAAHAVTRIIRVDGISGLDNPSGPNPGDTWQNAFLFLQDALDRADVLQPPPSEEDDVQIWVRGTTANPPDLFYKPDKGDNYADGSRTATFELRKFVGIYGGFAGSEPGTTAGFNSRNHLTNKTILSGDLTGDDLPNDPFNLDKIDENSMHIVTAPQIALPNRIDPTAVLDGFIITSGFAGTIGTPGIASQGGGIVIDDANPSIVRCTFKANKAHLGVGGAVWANSLSGLGQSPRFYNCVFDGNQAHWAGGAVHLGDELFSDGLGSFGGFSIFINCLFINNTVEDNDPELGQLAGGAVLSGNLKSGCHFINCTISRNNALDSAQANVFLHKPDPPPPSPEAGSIQCYNTIVWDNDGATTFAGLFSGDHYSFFDSNVQTDVGDLGTNMLNANPLFIDPNAGNFRLDCPGSPSIGTGYPGGDLGQLGSYNDAFDLDQDGDTLEISVDLDSKRRVYHTPDQGAYEAPAADPGCAGDVWPTGTPPGDEQVNIHDLLQIILSWGACADCPEDIAPTCLLDGAVGIDDLLLVINSWGICGGIQGSMPQSVQDCMDMCSESWTTYSSEWGECVDRCTQALCEAQIIECD